MPNQAVTAGRSDRRRISGRVRSSSSGRRKKVDLHHNPVGTSRPVKPFPSTLKAEILRETSFLEPCRNLIHSLILIGSAAYGTQAAGSDIDIVLITTNPGHARVCDLLFEKEVEQSFGGGTPSKFEYTVLSAQQTEELFRISSPFAYAICHGMAFQDDGYLASLCGNWRPRLPDKEYSTTCLYENIATPYYGMLRQLQGETKQKGCSLSCRKKNQGCKGLQPAHVFAKLIMRMLYVTLPARGMIPLSKGDVVRYAKKAYGRRGEDVAKRVVTLMRDKRGAFCFDEFRILKRFAVQLFKEILAIIGINSEVREIIVDASRLAREEYELVHNPAMKNCVV